MCYESFKEESTHLRTTPAFVYIGINEEEGRVPEGTFKQCSSLKTLDALPQITQPNHFFHFPNHFPTKASGTQQSHGCWLTENGCRSPSYSWAGCLVRMGGLSVPAAVTPRWLLKLMMEYVFQNIL